MIGCMRTTISLDDRIAVAARRKAAQQGVSFSALVSVALQKLLAERPTAAEAPFELLTAGRDGHLPGVDLDRTSALLVAEDEAIYGSAPAEPPTGRARSRRSKR